MFGKFPCKQCHKRFRYRQIVDKIFICLDCYAWAKDVKQRNVERLRTGSKSERDILDILHWGGYKEWSVWRSERMLTKKQADYILEIDTSPRPTMQTCQFCDCYYREVDAVRHATCRRCWKKLKMIIKFE